ncbi:MAG: tryptophan synthase subunit alpha [Deinococcales bacterium]
MMTTSRITQAFTKAKAENRAAFIPYLTAGFPDKEAFLDYADTLLRHADILEVGLPYSDPLGDGPTIQRSSEQALAQGVKVKDVFEMIAKLRAKHPDKAIVMMTYYNPIFCYEGGEGEFIRALKDCGADGVILPDLPPDEGEGLVGWARAQNLDTIFLVAPTSTDARLKTVSSACQGFIYAVSVTGVTGARESLPEEVPSLVQRTKALSDLPVAVGFGVKDGATAKTIAQVADGVVVGSALINAIEQGLGVEKLAKEIASACHK